MQTIERKGRQKLCPAVLDLNEREGEKRRKMTKGPEKEENLQSEDNRAEEVMYRLKRVIEIAVCGIWCCVMKKVYSKKMHAQQSTLYAGLGH